MRCLFFLILAFVFVGCDIQNESEKKLIEDAIYSLEKSNETIETFTEYTAKEFHEKKMEISSFEKVKKWEKIVDSILSLSNSITKHIYKVKGSYFNRNVTLTFSYNKDALLKFKNDGGDTVLFKKVFDYQVKILSLNEELSRQFETDIKKSFSSFLSLKEMNNYSKINLSKMLDNQFYLKLTELENRVKKLKFNLLEYCNIVCTPMHCFNYEKFAAIVGQNSNVFRKGDKVSITAGIGTFSTQAMPNISISNNKVEVTPDGVAIYEFAAPNQKGKYKVPVNIEYTKPDGTKEKKIYTIEYEVVE